MTPRDDDRDDDLAALLGATGDAAPPPDADFLAQLRDRSTDAFVGATPSSTPTPKRRFPMLAILLRVSTAAVAAALLIGVAVRVSKPDEPVLLAQALDRLADADTLHLRVIENVNGPSHDVWVAKGNKLRWDETAEKYQIVQGPNSYRVDETANRVTAGIADYFRPDRPGVDFFALLGLQRPAPDTIKEARPTEYIRAADGSPVEIYHIDAADRTGAPRLVKLFVSVVAGTKDLSLTVQVLDLTTRQPNLLVSLLVLAQGQPVPEEKFVVKPTLAEDGRVGKIVDVQGLVSVKPVTYARWTPVRPGLLLMPGDWVRADIRGANAATMRLLPQALVTVGPGGLLEVTKPNQIKLHEGEAEITPAKKVPIELTAPNGEKVTITERTHYRVEKEQLVKVEKEPLWLKGFKGTTNNESLGSLVAKVDGRNVPLSVGYHKVTVEIRDQIARTVIEESFVNHTDTQLEGQFHFPLPQDASIAGFAMDVNGEMVEADVVEKQRAREIYEEIMRERRDPGLLEWTGGNIFKARVWPIFAHSEKRIRITYTQVLPLQGKQYRYSYALQSEMLQLNPLKELAINLHVSSAVPLKSVTSPTHSVRSQKTDYAAKLEFSAQEHTPTKDFEAVIEVADAAPNVAVIPHRRGADGYFLVQVTPPAGAAPDRALIASAVALNLILVCDTSASMDPAQRNNQHALAASMLEALTPKDTFNLAACDVNADWAFDRPQQATPENITKARAFLMGRVSLGWTDLDRAFASVIQQVGATGHVVYLGDGIITTGNANPQEFAQRLTNLYKASNTTATFHAVALSSAFEPPVLKAIGSLGGGSVRRVTTEQGPVPVALELLGEITRPPVRDLRVEFKNWKTASVYPETLANLVPGTQQILIGRYLPEGADQLGEVVVTGVQNGQAVRYTAKATLKDAESGNSFLPRLWARMHLDKLLEKPQTQLVKDDIIALSEEFHIMTPYTSFLVLESDADRERFKVKRRFLMRDGEQFFAAGRDKADFELAREQMKKAGEWRTGLRRSVLSQFETLGRATPQPNRGRYDRYSGEYGMAKNRLEKLSAESDGDSDYLNLFGRTEREWLGQDEFDALGDTRLKRKKEAFDLPEGFLGGVPPANEPMSAAGSGGKPDSDAAAGERFLGDGLEFDQKELRQLYDFDGSSRDFGESFERSFDQRRGVEAMSRLSAARFSVAGKPMDGGRQYYRAGGMGGRGPAQPSYQRWFDAVIATVPAPVKDAPKSPWAQEARDLARSLRRQDALAKLPGGVTIERQTIAYDAAGQTVSRDQVLELVSQKAWAVRTAGDASPTLTQWCDGTDRGAYLAAWQLGRVRAAVPADLMHAPLDSSDFSWSSIDDSYHHFTATVEKAGDLRVIVAKQTNADYVVRFTIDPAKKVLLKVEDFHSGKPSTTRTYSDFVEVGGTWWATKSESTLQGKRTATMTQTVAALPVEKFAEQLKAATADRVAVQFVKFPEVTVAEAKKKVAAGTATFDDQFALLNHFAGYQQWAKANEHLTALEKLAADKAGVRWLRMIVLQASRRGEELRKMLLAEAAKLPTLPPGDRLTVATLLYSQAQAALASNEHLQLLDTLRPAYADLPKQSHARRQWQQYRISALQNSGKPDEAFALQTALAAEHPTDYSMQHNYAYALYNRGDRDAALAHLKKQFTKGAGFAEWEVNYFRNQYADWLEQNGRLPEVVTFTAEWMKEYPDNETTYSRHLSALVRTAEQEKADALVTAWLKDAQIADKVPAAAQAKFRVAAALAVGRGHNLYTDRLDPKWVKLLADAVRFFADHETAHGLADAVTQSHHFQHTDEGRKVYRELFDKLLRDAATMPIPRLTQRLNMLASSNFEVKDGTWATLGTTLRDRWTKIEDANEKYYFGQAVAQYHAGRLDRDAYVAFLRQQYAGSPEAHKPQALHNLFEALIVTEWSGEREAELFALLPKLDDAGVQVAQLHRLTDQMVALRNALLLKDLRNPEKLTRTELAAKHTELLNAARRGFTERLTKAEVELPEALRPWAKAERLYLLTRVGGDAKPQAAEVWEFLNAKPLAASQPAKTELDELLFERYLGMALYFASRTNATPDLVERTRKYLDAGIAAQPDESGWKTAKFQLLVALDKPQELETALDAWTKAGDADGRWRTALGYVLAEQGKLAEAIKLFEAVEKADELGYGHYQALAAWYMAVNKKDAHETALKQSFQALDENTLSQLVNAKVQPWYRGVGQMPTELDKDTLRLFAAIFEKSSYPANHLQQLRQIYTQSRDFRLLAVMGDSVIGQSAGKIYPFLGVAQQVLTEVRDEATADELLAHIEKLRATAKTAVDHRALDLLELQVRRRMAEVKNQPGPAAEKALIAMKRAFDRERADGERLMMSNLLRDFGPITRLDLAEEQLRELRELHGAAKVGTFERMHMAHNLGTVLGYQSRHAEGIDVMRKALTEYTAAMHDGAFTTDTQSIIGTIMSFHETLKQFDKAEELYLTAAKKPANDQQANWLSLQLYELYYRALDHNATVSLGEGQKLYQAVEKKLVAAVGHPDPNHNHGLVSVLLRIYRVAKVKTQADVVVDLKAFVAKTVPPMLKKHTQNYNSLVGDVARALRDLIGAEDAIVFLLDRIDDEPTWLRLNNQDGWSQQGYALAQWRAEAKNLTPKADARLLKLVTDEQRKDLRTQTARNRNIYTMNHNYYWAEKEFEFVKVAEEVYAERKESGSAVAYLAEYFYHGCNRQDRAIEVMFAAHTANKLDGNQQLQLVNYLFWRSRHVEAIPILVTLVEKSPETLHYRAQLCFAYFHSGREAELKTAFAAAEKFFREKSTWAEPAMSVLGHVAVECKLNDRAVSIYGELIPLHQRTAPNRGVGDGTLTQYYGYLARAHAGLGNTAEAVDAASGAVVAWGNNINGRTQALATLQQVLTDSPDLDKFVEHLDKQTGETGLINPVVRKATGQAYFNKSKFPQATMQLQAALSVQPNDAETQQLLIRAYDAMKNADGAVAQILRTLELTRRDVAKYRNLGDRFVAMDRKADAERAYTSIVEVLPNESEGHALLADIRQKQDRWKDAIKHWEEVAKIRALEPTGLLGLAAAQLHEKEYDAAAATLAKLKAKTWPANFPNATNQIAELERQLSAAKK